MAQRRPPVAYVEEEDEDGNTLSDTRRSARKPSKPSKSAGAGRSSKKERKQTSDSGYSSYQGLTSGSKDPVARITELGREERRSSRDREREKDERRRSSMSIQRSSSKATKPPLAHHSRGHSQGGGGNIDNDPNYYTPAPVIMQAPPRPRALTTQSTSSIRPTSYHGGSFPVPYDRRPPVAPSALYQPPMQMSSSYQPPPPSPFQPPPSPFPPNHQMTFAPRSLPQDDYFPPQKRDEQRPRTLEERFGKAVGRSISDRDVRHVPDREGRSLRDRERERDRTNHYTDHDSNSDSDDYDSATEQFGRLTIDQERQASLAKLQLDTQRMPPPTRPRTSLQTHRLSRELPRGYPSDRPQTPSDYERTRQIFRDHSPVRDPVPPQPRRQSISRASVSYHDVPVRTGSGMGHGVEVARSSRRSSYQYHVPRAPSADYTDQIKHASSYQHDVGTSVPLTAEMLRAAERRNSKIVAGGGGSSAYTRSSGSRDDNSEYKLRSATTRTTRSGSAAESGGTGDVTIQVQGKSRVTISGATIECEDGAELNIVRSASHKGGSSERGSVFDGESVREREMERERRSRDPGRGSGGGRTRMSSRSTGHRERLVHPDGQWI